MPQTAPIVTPTPIVREEPRATLARGIIAVHDAAPRPVRASRPEVRRVSVKHPASTAASVRRTSAGSPSSSRNVLDRLKLGWLRTAFTADR